ncbi:PQQ-binding-like beta-propeller repeat protein [Nocardioides daejeonensis]|uniref:outer membrane protein assembly factor BamB family protein n=1 Tax=Nocardioides daejeonensis TaxID=1046556 RepID=UPI0013A5314D|nr:PQQ-binding-like beta-propeller repeat protein [Nocardioides daejeonensis]
MSGIAAVALAATLLAACSNDEPSAKPSGDASTTVEPAFPPLQEVWRQRLSDRPQLTAAPLRVDGVLVLQSGPTLVGVDETTGEEVWRKRLREICSVAEGVHDQKLVLTRSVRGRDGACAELLALDPATGKVAWRRAVPGGLGSGDPDDIDYLAVGERVITGRHHICGGVERFRLSDGKRLPGIRPMGSDDIACDDFALKGRWIAQVASDDNQDSVAFRLINGDTGRTVFDRPIRLMSLSGIVSIAPLVMDLTVKGHRLLWAVDPKTGELETPISRQVSSYGGGSILAEPHGDTLAVSSARGAGLMTGRLTGLSGYGLDGTERWSDFPKFGVLLGGDDRGAVVATYGVVGDRYREQGVPITRHSWADVDDYEVLGTIPSGPQAQQVVGDLMLAMLDGLVVAYRLPEAGQESTVELTTFEGLYGMPTPEEAWAPEDIRPEADPGCVVSDKTLKSLGFHQLDLPRPVGCFWQEGAEPENFRRELDVQTFVGTPVAAPTTSSEDPDAAVTPASVAAEERLDAVRKAWASDAGLDGLQAKVRDLPGVGDEAIIVEAVGVGARQARIGIAVRVRNVVVWASMEGIAASGEATALASPNSYGEGVWSAVRETLAALGAPVTAPTVAGRSVPRLRKGTDLCAAVDAQLSQLVPGSVGVPRRALAEPASASCAWRPRPGDHDGAQVSLVRMADSTFSGRSGKQLAADGMAGVRADLRESSYEPETRPVAVPGLGDEAWARVARGWFHRSPEQTITWWVATVVVRQGDLSVAVHVQVDGWDPVALRERAVEIARVTLATQDG